MYSHLFTGSHPILERPGRDNNITIDREWFLEKSGILIRVTAIKGIPDRGALSPAPQEDLKVSFVIYGISSDIRHGYLITRSHGIRSLEIIPV